MNLYKYFIFSKYSLSITYKCFGVICKQGTTADINSFLFDVEIIIKKNIIFFSFFKYYLKQNFTLIFTNDYSSWLFLLSNGIMKWCPSFNFAFCFENYHKAWEISKLFWNPHSTVSAHSWMQPELFGVICKYWMHISLMLQHVTYECKLQCNISSFVTQSTLLRLRVIPTTNTWQRFK